MKPAAFAALALLMTGCTRSSVILLPGTSDHPTGKLAVINEDGSDKAVLDAGDSRVRLRGHVTQARVKQSAVKKREQAILDALPEKEARFILYFQSDSPDVSPDSEATLAAMQKEIERRGEAVDVEVVGYTDGAGEADHNQQLSEERAQGVLSRLVADGRIRTEHVSSSGRGELDPIEPNGPDGHQAKNRRVEVVVR